MRCYGFLESGSDWKFTTKDRFEGPTSTPWRRIATRYMRKCARARNTQLLREYEADTHPDAPYLMLSPWDYMQHAPCPWGVTESDDYFHDSDTLPWWIQEETHAQGNRSYVVEFEV